MKGHNHKHGGRGARGTQRLGAVSKLALALARALMARYGELLARTSDPAADADTTGTSTTTATLHHTCENNNSSGTTIDGSTYQYTLFCAIFFFVFAIIETRAKPFLDWKDDVVEIIGKATCFLTALMAFLYFGIYGNEPHDEEKMANELGFILNFFSLLNFFAMML